MRVAVLGAGIQGACAALALAERGCSVDLYDRRDRPLQETSRWNEGKIHLGYLFARDRSLRSARCMALGSLAFGPLLERWLGAPLQADSLSAPFYYVVHRNSQLSVEEVGAHLDDVDVLLQDLTERSESVYLSQRELPPVRRLEDSELDEQWSLRNVRGVFATAERSIDPAWLARHLRESVAAHPRVQFLGEQTVHRVLDAGAERLSVELRSERERPVYDHVVNALWSDRLRVDAERGLDPPRRWLFRFKYAVHVKRSGLPKPPPSSTLVLGSFGDIVGLGSGKLYLSWYPACRVGSSEDLAPPHWPEMPTRSQAARILRSTVDNLGQVVPAIAGLDLAADDVEIRGGVIFAWGATDIDDPESGLHERHAVGIASTGRYHSIDTGKYCLAPWFAEKLAERVDPVRRRHVATYSDRRGVSLR